MITIEGTLAPTDPSRDASYDGHYVLLEHARTLADDDVGYRASLTTPVNSRGQYAFVIEKAVTLDATARVDVRSPSGARIAGGMLGELIHDGHLRTIEVDPEAPFIVTAHPDPHKGVRRRLQGRLLDLDGRGGTARRRVLIFGVKADAPKLLVAADTDAKGYFGADLPPDVLESAFGEVEGRRVPIRLDDDGTLPPRIVLVATLPPADAPASAEIPRTPGTDDRLAAPETFSTDLGAGKCVDFTAPNRTLEEIPFYKLVRTTDPRIKGTHLDHAHELPPGFDRWLRTLAFGQGTLDTKLRIRRRGEDDLALSHEATVAGADSRARESATAVGRVAAVAAPDLDTPVLDALQARGVRTVARWRAALDEKSIDAALGAATLSPGALRAVMVDADDMTPVSLMTAERLATHQLLDDLLRVHRHDTAGRAPLDERNPVDWDHTPTFYQATTIAHGHLLQYRQVWKADGYSLGDLLHSIPLAPCQKKQIVTVDWDRREDAVREEDLTEQEVLFANLTRDRDVSEIIDTALREDMEGGSSARTYGGGGGLGFAIGPLVLGIGGGGGGASSEAWQDASRQISATSAQELRDRINQSAAAVRSQRATVVQTLGQGESTRVETEVIANHNHCHALTIQWFEVLRHFQVAEELAEVREVLFVPFAMSRFYDHKVLRWRKPLARYLMRRELRPAFDAIERIQLGYEGVDVPFGSYAEEPLEGLDGGLTVRIHVARPRDPEKDEPDYYKNIWWFWSRLMGGNPADVYERYLQNQQLKDRIFGEQLAPQIAEKFVAAMRVVLIDEDGGEVDAGLDPTLASKYRPGAVHTITLRDSGQVPPIPRKNIVAVEIRSEHELPEHSKVVVESARFTYHTRHLRHALHDRPRVLDDLSPDDPVYLPTRQLSREEERNPRAEDIDLRRRLLTHLNENVEYYHKVIWWSLDKERRYILLDGFLAPRSGGRSVASVVENELIGIVGNSLVFPVVAGYQLDPRRLEITGQEGAPVASLFDLYAPLVPEPPRTLSVPTKGVFAEAVLGNCNCCEKVDETRFWRWRESPCPDDPPAISPVSAASRVGPTPDLTATDFPAPIVNFQAIPEAPDPTGLRAAFDLIGRGDLFRDITGLAQNQANALGAMQASLSTAQAFGGEAVQLAHARAAQRTIDQTLGAVQDARKDGRLSDDAARAVTKGALQALIGQQGGPGGSVLDDASVTEALRAAAQADNSTVTVTDEAAGMKQSVEVTKEGPGAEGAAELPFNVDTSLSDYIECPLVVEELDVGSSTFEEKQRTRKLSTLRKRLILPDRDGKLVSWLSVAFDGKFVAEDPNDTSKFVVKAELQIYYPADPRDADKVHSGPALAMRWAGHPVVVLVHGQNAAWTYGKKSLVKNEDLSDSTVEVFDAKSSGQVPNHAGYAYLQEHLAKRGIVSVAILDNLSNQANALVRMRSEMVLRSLKLLRDAAEDPQSRYYKKLDFSNVGLLGHSRGGDAVIDLLGLNKDPQMHPGRDPLGIRAVCVLAPTDITGTATSTAKGRRDVDDPELELLVVYGTQDSDVAGARFVGNLDTNGTGFRHYDRANARKTMVFVTGATHNRFNTKWGAEKHHVSGTRLGDTAHQGLAIDYIGGFFRAVLGKQTDGFDMLGAKTASAHAKAAIQFRRGSKINVIDELEAPAIETKSPSVTVELFAPLKPVTSRDEHICHHTHVIKVPTAPGASLFFAHRVGKPPGPWDELQFRMAIGFDFAAIAATVDPKLSVTIEDKHGAKVKIDAPAIYGQNPNTRLRPDPHEVDAAHYMTPPSATPNKRVVTKLFFETYRVSLAGLAVDVEALTDVRFDFDAPTTALDVFIDSICLVRV